MKRKSRFISVGVVVAQVVLVICLMFVPVSQGNQLVETTCRKTGFYNLCRSTLQSDPRSSKADLAGLAQIGADKVKAKATATLRQITLLLKGAKDQKLQMALRDCVDFYCTIVKYDIPLAIEAIVKGDPKFGVQGATDAANEADDCERRFTNLPTSPISTSNKAVRDLSSLLASILHLLL